MGTAGPRNHPGLLEMLYRRPRLPTNCEYAKRSGYNALQQEFGTERSSNVDEVEGQHHLWTGSSERGNYY